MRARPIIHGGRWIIFTSDIIRTVIIPPGITLTVTIPPGIIRTIITPIIAMGVGMGITASPTTPAGEGNTEITGVEIMTATWTMTATDRQIAEIVVEKMKMATKIPAIDAMATVAEATQQRQRGAMYPPPHPGIPVTGGWLSGAGTQASLVEAGLIRPNQSRF